MSSREPLWFCHECHSEMHPLMVPDPVCASCRGSFVEKMENPADNPRDFTTTAQDDLVGEGVNPLLDHLLYAFLNAQRPPTTRSPSSRTRLQFPNPGQPTETPGDELPRPGAPPAVIPLSEFLRRGPASPDAIGAPLMMQYLLALIGGRGQGGAINPLGRMNPGDYVLNQEALDQIITQIMENSSGSRPVPATDEILENLPRDVLEDKSPLLEKDCAVCKEQFKLETEDPDELVVVTLPCAHPFHSPCILPWLKSSGTCPVCRHQLTPQPTNHLPESESAGSQGGHLNHSPNNSPGGSNNGHNRYQRSNSDPSRRSPPGRRHGFPGGWNFDE